MDKGYKYLVETFIPLNHDRYKTYFAEFIVVHLGIFVAMSSQFKRLTDWLCIIGIILSVAWFLVLLKIQSDIRKTWHVISEFEKSPDCQQKVKLTSLHMWRMPASVIMLSIPVLFAVVYILIFATPDVGVWTLCLEFL